LDPTTFLGTALDTTKETLSRKTSRLLRGAPSPLSLPNAEAPAAKVLRYACFRQTLR